MVGVPYIYVLYEERQNSSRVPSNTALQWLGLALLYATYKRHWEGYIRVDVVNRCTAVHIYQ